MNPTPTPEHQIRRPGWKSSEFAATAGAIAVTLLPYLLPILDDSVKRAPEGSAWGVIGPCIVAAGYALSRGLVKYSRNMASAAAAMPSALAVAGDAVVNQQPQSEAGIPVSPEAEVDGEEG